ncbi:MAG TPA: hypothetical protein VLA12_11675 [Planctomycetaceae bacterium]|nr:hypothetical protein [Planctomycetaceae bacterium]
MPRFPLSLALISGLAICLPLATIFADEFEREPINYSSATPHNPISELQSELKEQKTRLKFDEDRGYLTSVLNALDISPSSQTLVFSKTSLQRSRIAPHTPRAIYFNDDVYIGYCHLGEVLEISVADADLGTVFYTLDQEKSASPQFIRQTDSCLICHSSSRTKGVPGHLIRSIFSNSGGMPIFSAGSYTVDQSTEFEKRWGGWYVTGQHGTQSHLGNLVIHSRNVPEPVDNSDGQNQTDLSSRFQSRHYLTPHSDLVALQVLAHQVMGHNLISHASITTRQAIHYQESLNRELGEPAGHRWESTTRRIRSAGTELVDYLLFVDEARLSEPIAGTSGFAEEFAARGPFDSRQRSLREFDLNSRMFKYPCSYLVYTNSFRQLPDEMRTFVWERMGAILTGRISEEKYAHLDPPTRTAIVQILKETYSDLPPGWPNDSANLTLSQD